MQLESRDCCCNHCSSATAASLLEVRNPGVVAASECANSVPATWRRSMSSPLTLPTLCPTACEETATSQTSSLTPFIVFQTAQLTNQLTDLAEKKGFTQKEFKTRKNSLAKAINQPARQHKQMNYRFACSLSF